MRVEFLGGEEIAVKAHIYTLGRFSAHADQKGLLEWLSHFTKVAAIGRDQREVRGVGV